ncbi:winged helix-turn-helix transcriptional regulator [Candidatus Dojkabacteria bacterium]|nr:winged helix-turn-helix transcriptional regulator [Candidatus Dojkabacteria bacterium]
MHINIITRFLENLDLSKEEIEVYVTLLDNPDISISDLSHELSINRSKVYRTLDSLINKGYVNKVSSESKDLFKARGFECIKQAVYEKEKEVEAMKEELNKIEQNFQLFGSGADLNIDVKFYQGKRGIKQMYWNVAKSKTEVKKILNKSAIGFLGRQYWEDMVKEQKLNQTQIRVLYSESFYNSIKKIDKQNFRNYFAPPSLQTYKFLPEEVFKIENYFILYENRTTVFNWHERSIYGIEILNPEVASMLSQMFDILWNMGGKEHTIEDLEKRILQEN